jgi:hypothetical protein
MGIARLLAKAWIAVSLYAAAAALLLSFQGSSDPWGTLGAVAGCTALFVAAGLVFVAGYGLSSGRAGFLKYVRQFPPRFAPGFNEAVFCGFAVLSFLDQAFFAPAHLTGAFTEYLERAMYFAVPGQRAFADMAGVCLIDGGRIFASAFAWFLALVFLLSALSRLKRTAARIRRERKLAGAAHGEGPAAVLLAAATIAGIQFCYVGSGYALLPCSLTTGIAGTLLIGLAPLMLAYAFSAMLAILLSDGEG